jgi:hypothetical protein
VGAAALGLALFSGCKHDRGRGGPAPAASDRFADGKRLETAAGDWRRRFQNEPPPPSCAALLTRPDEQRLCVEAADAFGRLKARTDALDRSPEALRAAAELSRRAGAAAQKLRLRDMEYMGTQGLSLSPPKTNGSARSVPVPVPSALGLTPPNAAKPRPSASSGPDGGAPPAGVRRDDPYKPVLNAYARLEVQALRYLAVFLEIAPLATRERALTELEALSREATRPSHTLQQIVRQASLLETDPAFKERLRKLDAKSHLVPPASSGR